MDGNLSDMLQGVLSNPSAMEQIMGMAQSLMGDQGGNKASPPSPPPEEKEMPKEEKKGDAAPASLLSAGLSGNKERIALIHALRPYLSPERRKTADSLVKMLNVMKLADLNKLFKE